ncbi:MAG TPA: PAS domain-containing protein [Spirochaetia bacterium]|nr:PAS domain-containing protein [Spirochaetia bacterium]
MVMGQIPEPVLSALLDALPIEFSIVDGNDKVMAWNRHETRLFRRVETVLGRDVRQCHPSKSLKMVEQIISEMRQGSRDSAEFWLDMRLPDQEQPEKVLIQYFALRDSTGRYLGCLECSQKLNRLQRIQGQKRLLD